VVLPIVGRSRQPFGGQAEELPRKQTRAAVGMCVATPGPRRITGRARLPQRLCEQVPDCGAVKGKGPRRDRAEDITQLQPVAGAQGAKRHKL